MDTKARRNSDDLPAGPALRHGIRNKITPILLSTDFIGDSQTRSAIKECCLDMVSLLEELIAQYRLDQHPSQSD